MISACTFKRSVGLKTKATRDAVYVLQFAALNVYHLYSHFYIYLVCHSCLHLCSSNVLVQACSEGARHF